MPFLIFWSDHLQSSSEIISSPGSVAVQSGEHLRSWDHLRTRTDLLSSLPDAFLWLFYMLCLLAE